MHNVVRVDRDFDDPLPPAARNLDAVFIVLFYHDTVWMGVDRAKMNRAVFAALRPGGVYAIIDHSGRPGSGTADVQTLHRIDEQVVRDEVAAAGFDLVAEANVHAQPGRPTRLERFAHRRRRPAWHQRSLRPEVRQAGRRTSQVSRAAVAVTVRYGGRCSASPCRRA